PQDQSSMDLRGFHWEGPRYWRRLAVGATAALFVSLVSLKLVPRPRPPADTPLVSTKGSFHQPILKPEFPLRKTDWMYSWFPGPGEKFNSEPKALLTIGNEIPSRSGVYVTGLVQTEKDDVDILTLRLSLEGKLIWANRYPSPERDCDRAFSIATDGEQIFVAGETYIPKGHGQPEG